MNTEHLSYLLCALTYDNDYLTELEILQMIQLVDIYIEFEP